MVETPSKEMGLSTLFYLGGVLFAIVNVLSTQLRKSCNLPNSELQGLGFSWQVVLGVLADPVEIGLVA